MADRIPLIINASAQQIQELPSGDNLIVDGLITANAQPQVLLTDVSDYNIVGSAANGVPIQFGTVTTNVGCTLANSNSKVTVPSAGTYLITGGIGASRTNANADDMALAIKKNGSVFPSANAFPLGSSGTTNGEDFSFFVSMPLVLAANDYIELTQIGLATGGAQALVQTGYLSVTKLH